MSNFENVRVDFLLTGKENSTHEEQVSAVLEFSNRLAQLTGENEELQEEIDRLNAELAAAREARKLWQVMVYEVGNPAAVVIFDSLDAAEAAAANVEEDEFQWVTVTEYTLNDAAQLARFVKADEEGED